MKSGHAVSETLSYSVASYVDIAQQDETLYVLTKALLAYGRSAYLYVTNQRSV